jgi:hypothetical protein
MEVLLDVDAVLMFFPLVKMESLESPLPSAALRAGPLQGQ